MLNKLEVKELRQIGGDELEIAFCKGLAEAYSFASIEGCPAEGTSPLAIRSQVQWAFRVKSLWQKLMGSLPLTRIEMESHVVNRDSVIRLEMILANFGILCEPYRSAVRSRRLIPQCLHENHIQILQILAHVKRDYLVNQINPGQLTQGRVFFKLGLQDCFKLLTNSVQ